MTDLDPLFAAARQPRPAPGVTVGVVTNNRDPERLARVKVRYPALSATVESGWASVVSMMAGARRGMHVLPEPGDTVLVAFEDGDVNRPFVLGGFWSAHDRPPQVPDPAADHRVLRSRSGHEVHLDDSPGKERIDIVDKSGNNRISIETATNTITVKAAGPVKVSADGDLELAANGTVSISGQKVSIESRTDVEITADARGTVNANGPLALRGATVDIN
jgi:phage baseplate assembly protein V